MGKGIGSIFGAIGKLGNLIFNNPLSKAAKFGVSALLGPSLFVLGGALSLVGKAGLELGKSLHTRLVRSTSDNTTVKKVEAGWVERSASYDNFVSSSLKSCMFAWYDTAEFVRHNWAERQDEAGYGDSSDADPYDPEISATKSGAAAFKDLEKKRLIQQDNSIFPPSSVTNPQSSSQLHPGFGHGYSRYGGTSGGG